MFVTKTFFSMKILDQNYFDHNISSLIFFEQNTLYHKIFFGPTLLGEKSLPSQLYQNIALSGPKL